MTTALTDNQKKKASSFGDVAAAASSPGTQQRCAGIRVPLPDVDGWNVVDPLTAQIPANDAATAASPIAKAAGSTVSCAFAYAGTCKFYCFTCTAPLPLR